MKFTEYLSCSGRPILRGTFMTGRMSKYLAGQEEAEGEHSYLQAFQGSFKQHRSGGPSVEL